MECDLCGDGTVMLVPSVATPQRPIGPCVYVPENFDALAICDNTKWADAANWFIDRLYLYSHFGMRQDQWGFTPLKVAYLRRVIPQPFERELRQHLEEAGVIECDHHYIEGKKSFGYRLTERFQTRHKRIPIRHPLIAANIDRLRKGDLEKLSKVHQHLFKQFAKLSFDPDAVQVDDPERHQWITFSEMAIQQITNNEWTPVVCEYGRFHTPLTRMMSEFRQGLRLHGQRLINLDIANSQPLFLALLFLRVLSKKNPSTINSPENTFQWEQEELQRLLTKPSPASSTHHRAPSPPYTMGGVNNPELHEDVVRYVELVQQGQLYEFLGSNSQISRKEFKASLFKDVFYGQKWIRTALTESFEGLFPHVVGFIRRIKKGNYARLAWIMQKEESRLMIDGVCGRIMDEFPDLPLLTIHDSILTLPEHEQVVRRIITAEFGKVGLQPTIKAERY